MTAPRLTFSRHERLRGALRVREVALAGQAVHEAPFRLVGKRMELLADTPLQVAFAVPKRNLPRAVDRNLMKRRMREAFRPLKPACAARLASAGTPCAWLFIFQGRAPAPFATVSLKISRAADRWLQQHVPPHQ